jgi:hypothetical protein
VASDPIRIVAALHAALEAGVSGDALRDHFADSAVTIEHPNVLKPRGARSRLDEMLAASAAGAALLRSQRYAVHSAEAVGDMAIVRLTWTGVIATDAGPFRAGQELIAHIAQFVRTDGQRIVSIETYDCYEPFTTP